MGSTFSKILFYYDALGGYRGKQISYYFEDEPFVLQAEHCNAKGFYLDSSTTNGNRGSVPSINICRWLGPLENDPWNEDGRPPSLMFQMAMPQIEFCSGHIIIEGIEIPNMSFCGFLRPPYFDESPRHPDAVFMSEYGKDACRDIPFVLRKRQRIMLANEWK